MANRSLNKNNKRIISTVKIFYFSNVVIFFILGLFFDGGAYPWGKIGPTEFVIDNNVGGVRVVSEVWFWITFWQGLFVWSVAGLFMLYASGREFIQSFQIKKNIFRSFGFVIFSAVWTFGVLAGALKIVT